MYITVAIRIHIKMHVTTVYVEFDAIQSIKKNKKKIKSIWNRTRPTPKFDFVHHTTRDGWAVSSRPSAANPTAAAAAPDVADGRRRRRSVILLGCGAGTGWRPRFPLLATTTAPPIIATNSAADASASAPPPPPPAGRQVHRSPALPYSFLVYFIDFGGKDWITGHIWSILCVYLRICTRK